MVAVASRNLMTAREFECLQDNGRHYELIKGELSEMVPPGGIHGSITCDFTIYTGFFIVSQNLGQCFAAETGFLIERNPDTVFAPDWAFITKERLPAIIPEGYISIIPDIVLETRSPSDTKRKVAEKVARWLEAGVKIVWELNPTTKELTVYSQNSEPKVLRTEDTLTGGEILPDFSLLLSKIFGNY